MIHRNAGTEPKTYSVLWVFSFFRADCLIEDSSLRREDVVCANAN